METMTDWQEPLVEGEQYAGVIDKAAAKGIARLSPMVKEMLEKAAQIRKAAPDRPELISKGTEGWVHAHPDPTLKSEFAIIPHGDVKVRKVKKIPEQGIPVGEVYDSPGLREHAPDVLDTLLLPNPEKKTGSGSYHNVPGSPPRIEVSPYQLQSPSRGGQIIAHELTHATAGLPGSTGQYRGGNAKAFQMLANRTELPEQWQLAMRIRSGDAPLSELSKLSPLLAKATPKELMQLSEAIQAVELLRDKGFAYRHYNNLFGEGLARYVERHPNMAPSEVPPWERAGWDASRRMYKSLGRRMSGSISEDPFKSSMSQPTDVETLIHLLNR